MAKETEPQERMAKIDTVLEDVNLEAQGKFAAQVEGARTPEQVRLTAAEERIVTLESKVRDLMGQCAQLALDVDVVRTRLNV